MEYSVYIISSRTGKTQYIGHTNNLQRRLFEHRNGLSRWTKSFKDWELLYHEKFKSRSEAMKREKFFKTGKGREEIEKLTRDRVRLGGALVSNIDAG